MDQKTLRERLRLIREAGGLASVNDMVSVSLRPIIAAAGDLWEKRRVTWQPRIEEFAERHLSDQDAFLIEGDRLTLVFHPANRLRRDDVLFAIIRDLRDYFLGTVELVSIASDDRFPASGSAIKAEAAQEPDTTADAVMRSERGGQTATRMWTARYAPVWIRRVARDAKGVAHPLIVPRVTSEEAAHVEANDYYEPHPERTRIDISALRAAAAQARRADGTHGADGPRVYFSVGLATLRHPGEAKGWLQKLHELDDEVVARLVPIVVRVPEGFPPSSVSSLFSAVRREFNARFLGVSSISQLESHLQASPVQGFLVEQAPLAPPLDYARAASLCRKAGKHLLVIHSEDETEASAALSGGADLAAVNL